MNSSRNFNTTTAGTALATQKSPLVCPIIGITAYKQQETGNFYAPVGYVNAVRRAGGVPILLPPGEPDPAVLMEAVDGLVFTGGGDLDPVTYNGAPHPKVYGVDSERDASELALAKLALMADKPVLGICRGLEVLMVASGGDLVQHVPDEFGETILHRQELLIPAEHRVHILPDSQLASMIGTTEISVVSWHHQAVRTAPLGWRVVAKAPDGVIEALEHEDHPWGFALQWHPELSPADPLHLRIFEAFIVAAHERKLEGLRV
ncbi:gamma-glutamyl-gamma-aminobutyrate hydrolase family protein [Microcoleus sp. FACHB-SPT15]|uniref:gamma-glutamyl-gamma-aminobutyrate hydrolase family protein n=1 Tax=Microcoleus sp. FACHB-SPT15 TaxID=2692830 RepID=UPI0018EFC6CB|nr:gamma-glutamyl-gamma-aminobutyrate hydrolase family protein [Microcoleus sp. FACHB-SPT15]